MPVYTRADELLTQSKAHLAQAIAALQPIEDKQCSGADEYTIEFRKKLLKAIRLMRDVREILS